MPTSIPNIRTWCKQCNDWKIFSQTWNWKKEDSFCKSCATEFEEYDLQSLPEDKIQEQRMRYINQRQGTIVDFLNGKYSKNFLDTFFDSPSANRELIEDPAGMDIIMRQEQAEENKRIAKRKAVEDALKEKSKMFVHLNRNAPCACGSGKKYKKCCYDQMYLISKQHLNFEKPVVKKV